MPQQWSIWLNAIKIHPTKKCPTCCQVFSTSWWPRTTSNLCTWEQ